MTLATPAEMRMGLSGPPLMPFWAWSTLLHIGAVTLLSVIHFTKTIDSTAPVVQVTLVDTPVAEPSTKASNPKAEKADPKMPPPLQAMRPALPRPQREPPIPHSLNTLTVQTPMPSIPTPVSPREMVKPLQREALLDSRAINQLHVKNYFKVAQRSPVLRQAAKPHTRQLDVTVSTRALPTNLPTRSRTQTALTSQATPAIHDSPAPRMLKAMAPGSGNISKSKVGFGRTIPPVYPRIARESGWEGTVLIRVTIQADGNPDLISVRKSSGHTVLDQAAIEAVKKWKFSPAKDGNIPIRSIVEIPINFDLRQQG